MPKKLDRYEFIWKAIQVHGYKDDYREVDYQNAEKKVTIICDKHGKFEILPYNYLRGHRCQICGSSNITLESFLEKATKIHNNKFDYSLVTKIENSKSKIKIKCKKCGHIFSQNVHSHLSGKGCPKCAGKLITNEEIIEKIKKIYGDKYDTSKVKYVNTDTPITLICKIHGEFEITPHSLFRGRECPKCGTENSILKRRMTREEFIQKSQKIHKNEDGTPLYDYSKVNCH